MSVFLELRSVGPSYAWAYYTPSHEYYFLRTGILKIHFHMHGKTLYVVSIKER